MYFSIEGQTPCIRVFVLFRKCLTEWFASTYKLSGLLLKQDNHHLYKKLVSLLQVV